MGGALFAFLYWRKSKLNRSGASSQNQSILRSLGNRFSGTAYKATPAVRLDNIPPASNYVNSNAFELQHYDNQTFDDHFDGYQNFTDFSGSREVGIDVGPVSDEPFVQHQGAKLSNLISMTSEALAANKRAEQEASVLRELAGIENAEDPFAGAADTDRIQLEQRSKVIIKIIVILIKLRQTRKLELKIKN